MPEPEKLVPTITVVLTDWPSLHFAAKTFFVRDDGCLQIDGQDNRICAQFAPGRWTGVYFAAAKSTRTVPS